MENNEINFEKTPRQEIPSFIDIEKIKEMPDWKLLISKGFIDDFIDIISNPDKEPDDNYERMIKIKLSARLDEKLKNKEIIFPEKIHQYKKEILQSLVETQKSILEELKKRGYDMQELEKENE